MRLATALICIILLFSSPTFADNSEISNKDIQKFLDGKLKQDFVQYYKHYTRKKNDKKDYDELVADLMVGVNGELFEISKGSNNKEFTIDLTPTTKANALQVYGAEDMFAVRFGTRNVDKIIKVQQEDEGDYIELNVYFLATWYPDKYSKIISPDYEKEQFKGRAYMTFDIFTEQFTLKSHDFSNMDKSDWTTDDWMEEIDGKKMVVE